MPIHGAKTVRLPMDGRRVARYTPPRHPGKTWLSEALIGTHRTMPVKQLSLLATADREPGDYEINYSGDLALLKTPCIAVVGTRSLSDEGVKRTSRLVRELVEHSVTVVSGLADGVDSVAHASAIDSGGRTVAVIGTPLSKAYPAGNASLQEAIYREHLLISQFEDGDRVFRSNFPARNRLMATVTDGTVIMEASDTSGTLHQAAECVRLGRWLFIARSVVDDQRLTWPTKFTGYSRCVVLTRVEDIVSRVLSKV